jgi:RHS repeat-associated protein
MKHSFSPIFEPQNAGHDLSVRTRRVIGRFKWCFVFLLVLMADVAFTQPPPCTIPSCTISPCTDPGYPNLCLQTLPVDVTLKPLDFWWNDCCDQIWDYQIQVLRLYNYDPNYTPGVSPPLDPHVINTNVDWNLALSIPYDHNASYGGLLHGIRWLNIKEGTGYYVWRIRRIDISGNGHGDFSKWGNWSDTGPFVDGAANVPCSTVTAATPYLFYYDQPDDNLNWIYKRRIAEGEPNYVRPVRMAESQTFANSLLMTTQEQVKEEFWGDIMVTHTILDNLGRPSFKTVPVPAGGDSYDLYREDFRFIPSFVQKTNSSLYTTDDYDTWNVALIPPLVGGGLTNALATHFSDNCNSYDFGWAIHNARVPSSEGRPYSRTLFYNDGLNRPREIASPGPALTFGSGHTIKKYYCKATSTELIRVFGDEAPKSESVLKTYTVDPNQVYNVEYTDESGKVLATCLSSPQSGLLDKLDTVVFNTYDTITNEIPVTPSRLMASATYFFPIPTTLSYLYDILPLSYADACVNLCATCDYNITIVCRNHDDEDETHAYKFTMNVPPTITTTSGSCTGTNQSKPVTQYCLAPIGTPSNTVCNTQLVPGTYDVSIFVDINNVNPSTNALYIDEMITLLHDKLNTQFSDPLYSCQVLCPGGNQNAHITDIRTKLANNQINDLLLTYLLVDTTVPFFQLKVGCDTLTLPTAYCAEPNCAPPHFAEYMVDYLNDYNATHATSFFSLITTGTNGLANSTSATNGFVLGPTNSNQEFNDIIARMLAELDQTGHPVYNCSDLWDAWVATVQTYADGQVNLAGGTGGGNVLTTSSPKFDWWFEFMQHAGYKVFMEQRIASDLTVVGSQLRQKPYKYFPYTWGTKPGVEDSYCFSYSNLYFPSGWNATTGCTMTGSTPPLWYSNTTNGLMATSHNFPLQLPQNVNYHMYNFFQATKLQNGPFSNLPSLGGATNPANSNPDQAVAQMEALCFSKCENRLDEAVSAITQDLLNQYVSVEQVPYPAWQPNSIGSITQEEVYCMAFSVVEQCKVGCDLHPVNNVVPQIEITAYSNSMLGTLDLDVEYGVKDNLFCKDGDKKPVQYVATSKNRGTLAWMNRKRDQLSEAMSWSGTQATFAWQPYTITITNAANCSSTVNLYPLDHAGDFAYGIPAATTNTISIGGNLITVKRYVAPNLYPSDLVKINLEAKLSGGLAAGEYIKFIESVPTSTAGAVVVSSSMGFFDGVNYNLAFGGPLSPDTAVRFSYYIKVPYAAFTAGATVTFNGSLQSFIGSATNTNALTSVTSNISCPPLVYNRVDATNTPISTTVCSSCNTFSYLSCGTNHVCMKWIPAGQDIPLQGTTILPVTCQTFITQGFQTAFEQQLQNIHDIHEAKLLQQYQENCLDPSKINDRFINFYPLGQYQYTLYYYDRAGNLIRTVAPEGVNASGTSRSSNPLNTFASEYDFNTLSQVVRQESPDGGQTRFWYDNLGKIRFSQNAKQLPATYSYTKYDNLSRVIETGEVQFPPSTIMNPSLLNIASIPVAGPLVVSMKFITKTFYSDPCLALAPTPQTYLQNRISYTETDRDGDWTTLTDQTRTAYSYDPHGNVTGVFQQISGMPAFKQIRYNFDPIKGKPTELDLLEQNGSINQKEHFSIHYGYNGDMRLTGVILLKNTSPGYTNRWLVDPTESVAGYDYTLGGALLRTWIGTQGFDYTYTLQGWLKAINHSNVADDPSHDVPPLQGVDLFGMVLSYFDGDFKRSGSAFNSDVANSKYLAGSGLYNGNISSWAQYIVPKGLGLRYEGQTGYTYRYDQLNRLTSDNFYEKTSTWQMVPNKYNESFTYDKNGNIKSLKRYGETSAGISQLNDNLSYLYAANTNLLQSVGDAINPTVDNTVFSSAFQYDLTGNISQDGGADQNITWTPSGKLDFRTRTSNPSEVYEYLYDAMGNVARMKAPVSPIYTYYIRDATGNIIAIYENDVLGNPIAVKERYIYGLEKLATLKGENAVDVAGIITSYPLMDYEFHDHLGNVKVVWSQNSTPTTPDVRSYFNYYAFGGTQKDRSFSPSYGRFSFNGKLTQKAFPTVGLSNSGLLDFGARWYRSDYGRWFSVDPLAAKFPHESPYIYCSNNPIIYVDADGKEKYYAADGTYIGKYGDNDDIRIVKSAEIANATSAFADPSKVSPEYFTNTLLTTGSHEIFDTEVDAANGWGKAYNAVSIANLTEYGSTIYELEIDGKTYMNYSEPVLGSNDGTSVTPAPAGKKATADIHSHGGYEVGYDNNNFSPQDKKDNERTGITGYVTTPDGSLQKYDPTTTTTTTVNETQPSDKNDPDRKNKID